VKFAVGTHLDRVISWHDFVCACVALVGTRNSLVPGKHTGGVFRRVFLWGFLVSDDLF
jgi:hypothetical protein